MLTRFSPWRSFAGLALAVLLACGCRTASLVYPPREEKGFRPGGLAEADRLLEGFRERRAFPGGVLAVGYGDALIHLHPFGRLTYDANAPLVTSDTLYDLASLTKVVATTTMAMILVDEGKLDLERPVQAYLPGFQGPGKVAVTVRHLLTHSSGLDATAPLYKELHGEEAFVQRIETMDLAYPPGSRSLYSDLGIILLGEILERVAGQPLEAFARERVFAPLAMRDTMFRPPAELRPRIAPTEFDPWRGRLVHGEVHDENAFAMGGVAPHAGLFSTAGDLARFAQMILDGGTLGGRRIVSRRTVELFTRRAGIPGSDRALGWDTKSAESSSAGTLFSPRSFGHTGFTGTSMWIDPARQLFVILLTNRVHPTRDNQLIREARPAVADAVVRALADPLAGLPVRVGLERLAGETRALAGKRLGLIVHAASVTADGRHAVEVLRGRGLDVVRLFAPEHGLRGEAAAGEGIESGRDPVSGLPVVSLYGERRKPAPADLAGLDTLVFDLQDAGVRFYTYASTLILALEAAAEAGLDFVVLDRPNPLGGERVEGPVSAPRDVVPSSFLNLAPGPLVHGLTLGEMATYINARLDRPARLTVVRMEGWTREMTWADTGRPWVPPRRTCAARRRRSPIPARRCSKRRTSRRDAARRRPSCSSALPGSTPPASQSPYRDSIWSRPRSRPGPRPRRRSPSTRTRNAAAYASASPIQPRPVRTASASLSSPPSRVSPISNGATTAMRSLVSSARRGCSRICGLEKRSRKSWPRMLRITPLGGEGGSRRCYIRNFAVDFFVCGIGIRSVQSLRWPSSRRRRARTSSWIRSRATRSSSRM